MTAYKDQNSANVGLPSVGRLKWRCRRGTRELDTMLNRYLVNHYPMVEAREKRAFVRLLEMEDDLLWDWLSGRVACTDKEVETVVRRIRATD